VADRCWGCHTQGSAGAVPRAALLVCAHETSRPVNGHAPCCPPRLRPPQPTLCQLEDVLLAVNDLQRPAPHQLGNVTGVEEAVRICTHTKRPHTCNTRCPAVSDSTHTNSCRALALCTAAVGTRAHTTLSWTNTQQGAVYQTVPRGPPFRRNPVASALTDALCRQLRLVEVALEHSGAPDADLARGRLSSRAVAHVWHCLQPDLHTWRGHNNGSAQHILSAAYHGDQAQGVQAADCPLHSNCWMLQLLCCWLVATPWGVLRADRTATHQAWVRPRCRWCPTCKAQQSCWPHTSLSGRILAAPVRTCSTTAPAAPALTVGLPH
jgi:hypothetical protein